MDNDQYLRTQLYVERLRDNQSPIEIGYPVPSEKAWNSPRQIGSDSCSAFSIEESLMTDDGFSPSLPEHLSSTTDANNYEPGESSSLPSSGESSPISRGSAAERIPFSCVTRGLWIYIKPAEWSELGQCLQAEFDRRRGTDERGSHDGWYHIAEAISLILHVVRESRDKYQVLAYNIFCNMARENIDNLQNDHVLPYLRDSAISDTTDVDFLRYHHMILMTLIGKSVSFNNGMKQLYDVQLYPEEKMLRLILEADEGRITFNLDKSGISQPPFTFGEGRTQELWLFSPSSDTEEPTNRTTNLMTNE